MEHEPIFPLSGNSERYLEIDPTNQVLNCLLDIHGQPCGQEILRRAIEHDITMTLGQPGSGKTTSLNQLANELYKRGYPIVIVRYDDMLGDSSADIIEDAEFNERFLRRILDAFNDIPPGGKVLVDNCAVGNKIPKDRGVTAAEKLITNDIPDIVPPSVFTIAVVGSMITQHEQILLRHQTLFTSDEEVVQMYRDHNVSIEEIPYGFSEKDMGRYIKESVSHMAQAKHINVIRMEVNAQNMELIQQYGIQPLLAIDVPETERPLDITTMRFDAAGMERRAYELQVPSNSWLTVINLPQKGPITLYGWAFLPRTT